MQVTKIDVTTFLKKCHPRPSVEVAAVDTKDAHHIVRRAALWNDITENDRIEEKYKRLGARLKEMGLQPVWSQFVQTAPGECLTPCFPVTLMLACFCLLSLHVRITHSQFVNREPLLSREALLPEISWRCQITHVNFDVTVCSKFGGTKSKMVSMPTSFWSEMASPRSAALRDRATWAIDLRACHAQRKSIPTTSLAISRHVPIQGTNGVTLGAAAAQQSWRSTDLTMDFARRHAVSPPLNFFHVCVTFPSLVYQCTQTELTHLSQILPKLEFGSPPRSTQECVTCSRCALFCKSSMTSSHR